MANEISVSAILIEQEDGGYIANCPELGMNEKGENSDAALSNLKEAVARLVKEKGPDNLQLNAVRCLKFKVPV